MRVWEFEWERFAGADPLEQREHPSWEKAFETERRRDEEIRGLWLGYVPGSGAPVRMITATVQAVENLGYRVAGWEEPAERGFRTLERGDMGGLISATVELKRAVLEAEVDEGSEYWRYRLIGDFPEFLAAGGLSGEEDRGPRLSEEILSSKMLGSWTGQAVGDALGTALEGYCSQKIRETYGAVEHYVTSPSTLNDDITYQIVLLETVLQSGDPAAAEIAEGWALRIPYAWSAEAVALNHIMEGLLPPVTASRENPYREWIGAQMRGAVPGLLSAGNPRCAAELAWRDGCVSHTANGILGELFNSIASALAFWEHEMREVVRRSVEAIPAESRYGAVVRDALETCRRCSRWDEAWAELEQRYRRYHWIHCYPNACAEVVALWFGDGDFDRTAQIVANEGMDTDCNAAQVLAVAGTLMGAEAIPQRWTDPLGGKFETYLRGQKEYGFRELTELSLRAARKLRRARQT